MRRNHMRNIEKQGLLEYSLITKTITKTESGTGRGVYGIAENNCQAVWGFYGDGQQGAEWTQGCGGGDKAADQKNGR